MTISVRAVSGSAWAPLSRTGCGTAIAGLARPGRTGCGTAITGLARRAGLGGRSRIRLPLIELRAERLAVALQLLSDQLGKIVVGLVSGLVPVFCICLPSLESPDGFPVRRSRGLHGLVDLRGAEGEQPGLQVMRDRRLVCVQPCLRTLPGLVVQVLSLPRISNSRANCR